MSDVLAAHHRDAIEAYKEALIAGANPDQTPEHRIVTLNCEREQP